MNQKTFATLTAFIALNTSLSNPEDAYLAAQVIKRNFARIRKGVDEKQTDKILKKLLKLTGMQWDTDGSTLACFVNENPVFVVQSEK